MLYRAYGLVFASDIAFPDVAAAYAGSPAVRFVMARGLDATGWRGETGRPGADGRPWLVVSRRGREYRLRFGETADFVLQAGGRTISVYRRAGTSLSALRHVALNQVLPLVLGHRGQTVLHASAFAMDGRAIALMGPAGAGKSTLVASFAANGRPMMADDAVRLRRRGTLVTAIPAYNDIRVRRDTFAMLRRARKPLPFFGDPLPLSAMYVLARGSRIRIDRLSRRESLIELLRYSFALDVADRRLLLAQLDRLTRDLPGVRRLTYPRDYRSLPRVRDAIAADLLPPAS
jgi:hypothetical protein